MSNPQEVTDILSRENTFFFVLKRVVIAFIKSYYNINLILPLPLIMPESFYEENERPNVCCWFLTEASVAPVEATPLSGHGEVHSIQHVIKFVSDLRQVGGFLLVLGFSTPIKPRRYNWNIIESGGKRHTSITLAHNPSISLLEIIYTILLDPIEK